MSELNESAEQSLAPDFRDRLQQAGQSGDFSSVLKIAQDSHRMLIDFRDVVKAASFAGREAAAVAMGLNFLENMIPQAKAQLDQLKQAEKATREAIKAARSKGPEEPGQPEIPAAEAPGAPNGANPEVVNG